MSIVGYIRVSTVKQLSGHSLNVQREQITQYAAVHGMTSKHIHSEGAASGASMRKRPALKRAIDSLEAGDILCVQDVSRLTRSLDDSHDILRQVEMRQASIVSVMDNFEMLSTFFGNTAAASAGAWSQL